LPRRYIIRMWPAYSASVERSDTPRTRERRDRRRRRRPDSGHAHRLGLTARARAVLFFGKGDFCFWRFLNACCGGRKWRIQFTVQRFYDLLSTPRLPNAPSLWPYTHVYAFPEYYFRSVIPAGDCPQCDDAASTELGREGDGYVRSVEYRSYITIIGCPGAPVP